MKLMKKLAILCLSLLTTAGMATACSFNIQVEAPTSSEDSVSASTSDTDKDSASSSEKEEDKEEDVTPQFVYRVKVQNATGYGFRGLTVRLKNGAETVAEKTTSSSGYATFGKSDILALGSYDIEVDGLPTGYKFTETTTKPQTIAKEGFEAFIQIEPIELGPIMEATPIGTVYSLGDVMYDFTVKTSDNTTFTLSEVLKEKDMVLINFWATWCGPCKSEFPAMNAAYEQTKDDVAVLAISTTDTMSAVKDFKASNGILFDMTSNSDSGANVAGMFNTSAIPVSIMVDRYGVITYYHTGSMTAATDFTSRFNKFIGDGYQPTVIVGSGEEENEGGEGENNILIKPTMQAPDLAEIKNALGGSDDFTYEWDTQDEYSWPWLVDGNWVKAAVNVDGNYSTLITKLTAQGGNTFSFDYNVTTEAGCDILYVLIDGVPIYQLSGKDSGTCSYVFRNFEAGEHTIHFLYLKDGNASIEGESVKIQNLRLEDSAENAQGAPFHHAANVVNVDKDGNLIDESKNSYYQYYETVVLNEEDGYYHVGTENGPILFANLMLGSRWSESSIWLLAYYDYIISEGYNFHADIEDFAWEANQPIPDCSLTYGYTPVTQALRELLEHATRSAAIKEYGYKYWTGDYHENEWLEMCVFWNHYTQKDALEDPMKTITFHAAEEVYAGTKDAPVKNTANVLFAMTPRGFKYKFIPETSGVYNVYSTGELDTTCFLMSSDRELLGDYTDVIGANHSNFNFHYYFEAGETYYLLLTTYLDQTCSYDFYIDYVGDTYTYLENMSVGPYSYNEISGELYLPDAKAYEYDEMEDSYYVLNKNGERVGKIYVDMLKGTVQFPRNSLYQTAIQALEYDKTKRAFYIDNTNNGEDDGVDYSEYLADVGYATMSNSGMYYGYATLNKELFEAICAITRSVKYDGITDTWQLLCYYVLTLGEA